MKSIEFGRYRHVKRNAVRTIKPRTLKLIKAVDLKYHASICILGLQFGFHELLSAEIVWSYKYYELFYFTCDHKGYFYAVVQK